MYIKSLEKTKNNPDERAVSLTWDYKGRLEFTPLPERSRPA